MLRETDLPSEKEWESFFSPRETLTSLGLRRGIVFADLGCGYGTFAIPAAKIVGNRGCVYAVDIDPQMTERVRERANEMGLSNIIAKNGNIFSIRKNRLGIPAKSVDIALLANLIHGTRNKIGLLKSVTRILRHNGSIAVINWKLEKTPRGPPMNMRPSEEVTVECLSKAGYLDPKVLHIPGYHYAVLAHLPTGGRKRARM